tara:strand:- start:391 stop:1113 length:723 start_codon:yes stop_codon:yes gene_type:complete
MPLVSTRGCGPTQVFQPAAAAGGGGGGLYATADLYYDLESSSQTSGSASGGNINLGSYGSFSSDENGGGTVLQANGGANIKFAPNTNPGSSHTVSVWYRSNSSSSSGMLMSKSPSSNDTTYDLDIWDGGGNERIFANNGDGYGNPYSNSNGHRFNHNDWKHYVFTFDGSTPRYWRDGSDYGTAPTYRSWNGYDGSWSLGSWSGPYFGSYALSNGRWKKFAAWHNTVLTSSQIGDLYSAGL